VLVVGQHGGVRQAIVVAGTVNKLDIAIPAPPPGLLPEQGGASVALGFLRRSETWRAASLRVTNFAFDKRPD